jgi:histidine ammonia-lyase
VVSVALAFHALHACLAHVGSIKSAAITELVNKTVETTIPVFLNIINPPRDQNKMNQ